MKIILNNKIMLEPMSLASNLTKIPLKYRELLK